MDSSTELLKDFLRFAISKKCSDIFIDENKRGSVRIKRETLRDVTPKAIPRDMILEFFRETNVSIYEDITTMMNDSTIEAVDAAFNFEGRRFRANICMAQKNLCCVFRLLNAKVPDINKINMPASLRCLAELDNGLVLVVGETGSGKTMTLAALIEFINERQKKNIITIEDPIEYIYTPKQSRIVQREVGVDTPGFSDAIKSALRSAPDICLVGEMRDLPTIESAIQLAETGHLVFATLHSVSCTETPDRIVDVFPAEKQQQIRVELAGVLRAVIHQKLIKNYKGDIVPLAEIMIVNPVIATCIKDSSKWRSSDVKDYMRAGGKAGNVHIIDNAYWHYKNNRLNEDDIKTHLEPRDSTTLLEIINKQK